MVYIIIITNSTFINSIMLFIILYKDYKTIGFKDFVKRLFIIISAGKNQDFLN
jgi:hypothetical protein